MKKIDFVHSIIKQIMTLLIMNLLFINPVAASETDIKPFVKGSFKQIQQKHNNKAYIISFWSESCAYCMKELAMFGKLLQNYPDVELVSITTDPFLNAQTVEQILSSKNLQKIEKWVFADDYVERLYYDIEPGWRGELPLTYFFDRHNKKRKHMRVIQQNELISWLAEQQIDQ